MYELQGVNQSNSLSNQSFNADLFNRYINFIDASPKTIATYTRALKQLFVYFMENNITQPTRADIINFRDSLKANNYKPTTIQNYIVACRLFFKWLENEGYYPNIAENVKGAKIDKQHKKDYLTSNQVKEVLNTIDKSTEKGARDYAIMLLIVTCALRTIEVERANITDLRTLGNHTVLYIQGKGEHEKADYVKIPPAVEKAIRQSLKYRKDKSEEAPLFISLSNNSLGNRLSTRTISKICKDAFIKAGYDSDRITAHSLRHTAITLSLLANEDITVVQKFARHANIANTMIYNHAIDMMNNDCSNIVADAIL